MSGDERKYDDKASKLCAYPDALNIEARYHPGLSLSASHSVPPMNIFDRI